ncbi:methionyl-tRNA formyltransferase [Inhella gelatinilytica]|uniref:Methionyl-tRNA formyltransferase n=1 Tax=Inhella gelatinilytica TaxID=2795030 RepID=A0A931J0I3_9BURK|nr:methionyl-tRNA formyltransferase [Inhella gelatinilytica]MBH9553933.1 methionyl-tRNA formyltransferase [Inhella gelatinilytica]
MRLVFAGTPEFAAQALDALVLAGHKVVGVLTQPDRPAGRGMKLQASPVKQRALAAGIAVAQPQSLRLDGRFAADAQAARAQLQSWAPELMVVAAYGLILPQWVLDLPPQGCLNIHASLLPRWRGAAPIQRCIEAGDAQTGVTLMQMDAGLDTGAMRWVEALPLATDETAASLHDRLAAQGARLVVQALERWPTLPLEPQPEQGVTYAAKIDKREAWIDWQRPAAEIERRLRAFDPFPGGQAAWRGAGFKVWRVRVESGQGAPGTVLALHAEGPEIACGDGSVVLTELQRPGGRRGPAALQATSLGLVLGEPLDSQPPEA